MLMVKLSAKASSVTMAMELTAVAAAGQATLDLQV
jgi:hypothetical protein